MANSDFTALGIQPRVAPEAGIRPIAGETIGANAHVADVSPLSDPFHAGLLGNSAAPLFNRSAPHPGSVGGAISSEESPLDLTSVNEVVGDAQARGDADVFGQADQIANEHI